jgi:hypothetical protein
VHLVHAMCAHVLHLSSALADTHGNSSASLALFPCVQHHWVFCWDSSTSLSVETLRLLCNRRAHAFYKLFFFQNSQSCTVCLIFFFTHLTNGFT